MTWKKITRKVDEKSIESDRKSVFGEREHGKLKN